MKIMDEEINKMAQNFSVSLPSILPLNAPISSSYENGTGILSNLENSDYYYNHNNSSSGTSDDINPLNLNKEDYHNSYSNTGQFDDKIQYDSINQDECSVVADTYLSLCKVRNRISCHKCGNVRKNMSNCVNNSCPHSFCVKCVEKMMAEHGSDTFQDGCPVCMNLCCCSNPSLINCKHLFHCYRKCKASYSISTKSGRHRKMVYKPKSSSLRTIEVHSEQLKSDEEDRENYHAEGESQFISTTDRIDLDKLTEASAQIILNTFEINSTTRIKADNLCYTSSKSSTNKMNEPRQNSQILMSLPPVVKTKKKYKLKAKNTDSDKENENDANFYPDHYADTNENWKLNGALGLISELSENLYFKGGFIHRPAINENKEDQVLNDVNKKMVYIDSEFSSFQSPGASSLQTLSNFNSPMYASSRSSSSSSLQLNTNNKNQDIISSLDNDKFSTIIVPNSIYKQSITEMLISGDDNNLDQSCYYNLVEDFEAAKTLCSFCL